MNKYTCENYRPVTAKKIGDAAMEFAGRAARREYGRRAYAANCVAQSWTEDHTMVQYQAFIGTKCDGGTAGKNITFSVYLEANS